MSDFKQSLNILKTDFEMKANLPIREPEIQKKWIENQIYQKILLKNKNNPQKILHDGPPYANGSIHVGHALNKILKDFVVRRWNLEGYYSHYIPGWDTHGMPIEHALIKKGINTDPNLTIGQKRENCRKFANEQKDNQKTQFARLGLETDMKDIYMTLDNSFEKNQLEVFLKAIKLGLIYQDLKPVYWSWSSQTALAEAEVEYANEQSESIYVSFNVETGNDVIFNGEKLLVWTTTPWTLPSNQAIAVNPHFTYVKFKYNDNVYICVKTLLGNVCSQLNFTNYEILSEFKGNMIENVTYKHLLYGLVSPIILADYVSDTNGTGLVHNASGFGNDDYLACKRYGIKPYVPIDAFGKFNNEVIDKELVGMFYLDANLLIIEKLKTNNVLLKHETITHSVAHDWRTKKQVMYRATKQWFVNIDKIKDGMINSVEKVKFPNKLNKTQLIETIKNRVEWCISRQRYWGVPIPIIYDENNDPILDTTLIQNIINILAAEGSDIWFDKPVEYFLTNDYDKNKKYKKETDIMDVWFDSGTTWSVLIENKLQYPAELYLEGKDQFRGWFNSSLINSYIYEKTAPYKQLLGCGFVLDEKGIKMSKSIGNVVDPLKVCNEYGADILRLWVAGSNYSEDVKIGDNILKQFSETYRRIRNTLFKFILSNISDFNYKIDMNTIFTSADVFILNKLKDNVEKLNNYFENFQYIEIINLINNHIVELSSWYFDITKDALYCDNANDQNRRAVQTVLFQILTQYIFILAPIIPHTCEEAYSFINIPNKQESVFLHAHKFELLLNNNNHNHEQWEQFFKIKGIVFSKLEELRINKVITKNTQAFVTIHFNNMYNWTEEELKKYLNVAKAKIFQKDSLEFDVNVENSNFSRCERCWNYFENNEIDNDHLCERCAKIIKNKQ
ncbi:MAG: isoleucine--tRNA ligase [Mycoplasmataceae bacterium]|nr:isoleucine--tRNA ligase [Mycoplasmataceae bacterium]